jgi:hypothetical protein
MNAHIYGLNLGLAWGWIALGVLSGIWLGWGFHRDGWLGGYDSLRRRSYRLGHISFFGLGFLNLAFYFTAGVVAMPVGLGLIASWGLILGGLTMPLCCLVMAHWPRGHLLFAIPVLSLGLAVAATLWALAVSDVAWRTGLGTPRTEEARDGLHLEEPRRATSSREI